MKHMVTGSKNKASGSKNAQPPSDDKEWEEFQAWKKAKLQVQDTKGKSPAKKVHFQDKVTVIKPAPKDPFEEL